MRFIESSLHNSFCIVGVKYPQKDEVKIKKKLTGCSNKDELEDMNLSDVLYNKTNCIKEDGGDKYAYEIIIGMHIVDMKEDETLKQFKQRVAADLKNLGIEYEDIDVYIDIEERI